MKQLLFIRANTLVPYQMYDAVELYFFVLYVSIYNTLGSPAKSLCTTYSCFFDRTWSIIDHSKLS